MKHKVINSSALPKKIQPKVELPEYGSDDDCSPKQEVNALPGGFLSLDGGMEVLPAYPPSYAGELRTDKYAKKCITHRRPLTIF